mmetsp:Transcript_15559/g.39200  ORF Transcript_15559/g.39200 Transcript_15559/m.39200 type:complete len:326 (+) Transcript_15559:41-1018(+)
MMGRGHLLVGAQAFTGAVPQPLLAKGNLGNVRLSESGRQSSGLGTTLSLKVAVHLQFGRVGTKAQQQRGQHSEDEQRGGGAARQALALRHRKPETGGERAFGAEACGGGGVGQRTGSIDRIAQCRGLDCVIIELHNRFRFDSSHDPRGADAAHLREGLLEVGISQLLQLALVGARAAGLALPGLVELVDELHALLHEGEGGEALAVKKVVVAIVEEDLKGARVAAGRREGDVASCVGGQPLRVVRDGVAPGCASPRVRGDAHLRHETVDDAEEAGVVIEPGLDELAETLGAARGPLGLDAQAHLAGGRAADEVVLQLEDHVERGW